LWSSRRNIYIIYLTLSKYKLNNGCRGVLLGFFKVKCVGVASGMNSVALMFLTHWFLAIIVITSEFVVYTSGGS